MKNIAIMIPTLSGGGAERIAGLLSIYLSSKYNVYILVERDDNISYNYKGKLLKIPLDETGQAEAAVREYKKKYEIDCTISFLERMDILNIRTKVNDLIIVSERLSNGEMEPYSYGMEQRIRYWYPYADRIVAVSHGTAYDLAHNYGIEDGLLTTIYNFIDKKGIAEKASRPLEEDIESFLGGSKLILNVGRLAPQKNQRKLLRQFAKLVERGYDAKLIIVGTGPLEDQLRQMVDELGLNSHVRLEAYGANPFPYYKLAAMMALSSDCEGLPNVVLEAMTLGLPVVAVDCLSGPRELLKDSRDYTHRTSGVEVCKRGILVEKAHSDEMGETSYLADGMAVLLNDPALRTHISQECCAYMQQYSNEKIYSQWLDVIEHTSQREKIVPPISIPIPEGCRKVIVYGAGQHGKEAMAYLAAHEMNLELLCFAVSDGHRDKKEVLGMPVYEIGTLTDHTKDSIVIVGVAETYEAEVRQTLDRLGFRYIYKSF